MHWLPNRSAPSAISCGLVSADELIETLSRARAEHPVHVVNRPQTAADGERDEHLLGGAAHGIQQ